LTFVYNGIVSEKCNLVTVAANTVTASTDCQAALRAIPGLGGADVVVKKTAGAGAGGADGITVASGLGGVDLMAAVVTLPKGVDGSGLTATLSGAIIGGAHASPLSGNEYLYRKHWRNNNGRSFTVTKVRENRVGGITAINDASDSFNVEHEADVHGMVVPDGEFVAVHNIPNGRTSEANSYLFSSTGGAAANMAHAQRGQVYRLGTSCYLQLIETDAAQGQDAKKARFHHVSGGCDNTALLAVAHQGDTAVIAADGSNTLSQRITGASDIILVSPNIVGSSSPAPTSSVTSSFDSADNVPQISDALASVAGDMSYANAYYGVGGDMLVVDSKPDAIRGGSAIEMDITYTGPSGSCSVEEVTKGSKESAVCSNRGVCDYETGTCVCAEGFMKEACSEQSVLV